MEKITLSHHLVMVMKIKKENYAKWEKFLLVISGIRDTYDPNVCVAGLNQLLSELPFWACKRKMYIRHLLLKKKIKKLKKTEKKLSK